MLRSRSPSALDEFLDPRRSSADDRSKPPSLSIATRSTGVVDVATLNNSTEYSCERVDACSRMERQLIDGPGTWRRPGPVVSFPKRAKPPRLPPSLAEKPPGRREPSSVLRPTTE